MTLTNEVRFALRKRFAAPAWALLEEVRDFQGHDAKRSADAIAMGLWKSRGHELQGCEIKTSRGDWLREMKEPEKAETISRFCDRWWIVAHNDAIVHDGELPPNWGLLVLHSKTLRTKVEAPRLVPEPMPRHFLASILRRSAEMFAERVPPEEVEAVVAQKVADRLDTAKFEAEDNVEQVRERAEIAVELWKALGMEGMPTRGVRWTVPKIKEAFDLVTDRALREEWEDTLQWNANRVAHAAKETKRLLDLFRSIPAPEARRA